MALDTAGQSAAEDTVAIKALGWIIQVQGNLTDGWLKYPTVLGLESAARDLGQREGGPPGG